MLQHQIMVEMASTSFWRRGVPLTPYYRLRGAIHAFNRFRQGRSSENQDDESNIESASPEYRDANFIGFGTQQYESLNLPHSVKHLELTKVNESNLVQSIIEVDKKIVSNFNNLATNFNFFHQNISRKLGGQTSAIRKIDSELNTVLVQTRNIRHELNRLNYQNQGRQGGRETTQQTEDLRGGQGSGGQGFGLGDLLGLGAQGLGAYLGMRAFGRFGGRILPMMRSPLGIGIGLGALGLYGASQYFRNRNEEGGLGEGQEREINLKSLSINATDLIKISAPQGRISIETERLFLGFDHIEFSPAGAEALQKKIRSWLTGPGLRTEEEQDETRRRLRNRDFWENPPRLDRPFPPPPRIERDEDRGELTTPDALRRPRRRPDQTPPPETPPTETPPTRVPFSELPEHLRPRIGSVNLADVERLVTNPPTTETSRRVSPLGQPPRGNLPSVTDEAAQNVLTRNRERFRTELENDPDLRLRWAALMLSEQSGVHRITVGETMVNRANAWGVSLNEIISNRDYYEPYQNGAFARNLERLRRDPRLQQELFAQQDAILGGSNQSRLATHNASAEVAEEARETQRVHAEGGGEVYTTKTINPHLHGIDIVRRERNWLGRTQEEIRIERERTRIADSGIEGTTLEDSRGLFNDRMERITGTSPPPQETPPTQAPPSGERTRASGPLSLDEQRERPRHYTGNLTFQGESFRFGTGSSQYYSSPYGTFELTPNANGPIIRRLGGYTLGGNRIYDPLLDRYRGGVAIHRSGSDRNLVSQGCIAIARSDWPRLRQLIEESRAQGQRLAIRINPNGQAELIDLNNPINRGSIPTNRAEEASRRIDDAQKTIDDYSPYSERDVQTRLETNRPGDEESEDFKRWRQEQMDARIANPFPGLTTTTDERMSGQDQPNVTMENPDLVNVVPGARPPAFLLNPNLMNPDTILPEMNVETPSTSDISPPPAETSGGSEATEREIIVPPTHNPETLISRVHSGYGREEIAPEE